MCCVTHLSSAVLKNSHKTEALHFQKYWKKERKKERNEENMKERKKEACAPTMIWVPQNTIAALMNTRFECKLRYLSGSAALHLSLADGTFTRNPLWSRLNHAAAGWTEICTEVPRA